jgi:hypothetical protein
VIAISKEELMRKLIATTAAIAAALALAGVGLGTRTATSDAPAYAMLPYIEQDNVYRAMAMDV